MSQTPLKPFAGQMKRWPPVLQLRPGTWDAVVTVTPLTGGRGQDTDARHWEISANWHGPGLPGLPPTRQPVDATDFVLVSELELAKAVALAAVDEIRQLRVPDLRALVRRFQEGK
jgi:hypothetical protein